MKRVSKCIKPNVMLPNLFCKSIINYFLTYCFCSILYFVSLSEIADTWIWDSLAPSHMFHTLWFITVFSLCLSLDDIFSWLVCKSVNSLFFCSVLLLESSDKFLISGIDFSVPGNPLGFFFKCWKLHHFIHFVHLCV